MSRARDLATFVSNADGDIKFDTDTLFIDSSANRVGIQTSTPSSELEIAGSTDGGDVRITFSNNDNGGTNRTGQVFFDPDENTVGFRNGGVNRLHVDSSGNVGVGTSSPSYALSVVKTTTGTHAIDAVNNTTGAGSTRLILRNPSSDTNGNGFQIINNANDGNVNLLNYKNTDLALWTNAAERMRIDSSGNLLVGHTNTNPVGNHVPGTIISPNSGVGIHRDNGQPLAIGRNNDGNLIGFYREGNFVGGIGVDSTDNIWIGADAANHAGLYFGTTSIYPYAAFAIADNVLDMGNISYRFDDVYATNGTIQTSDRNEKQDIEDLSEAELRVATAAKGLIKKYRWIDAVQEKGDDARIHVGIIAQDLQAAFEAEGLDAGRYAMFISSTWWEADEVIPAVEAQEAVYETQTDEEGNETQVLVTEAVEAQPERTVTNTYETAEEAPEGATERTRLGVRYPELLAFIIGAM